MHWSSWPHSVWWRPGPSDNISQSDSLNTAHGWMGCKEPTHSVGRKKPGSCSDWAEHLKAIEESFNRPSEKCCRAVNLLFLWEMITGLAALKSALSYAEWKSQHLSMYWGTHSGFKGCKSVRLKVLLIPAEVVWRRGRSKSGWCLPFIKVDFLLMPQGGGYIKMPLFLGEMCTELVWHLTIGSHAALWRSHIYIV